MDKIMIILGIILITCGIGWRYFAKVGFNSLPGDLAIRGENYSFYFPVTTCIVLSFLLSLGTWIFKLFK